MVVPLIAVHLFVFYFGILADDTPPVGLAAFAAAAISGDDPIKTGVQGFTYDIRTAILPFMFIFNTQLLLIGIDSIWQLVMTIVSATTAILVFSAATQGFWLVKTKWWETVALLLVAFILFRPGFFWDEVYPSTQDVPATTLVSAVETMKAKDFIQFNITGVSFDGDDISKTVSLQLENENVSSGIERLADMGLTLRQQETSWVVDNVAFGSAAEKAGIGFDFVIASIQQKADRLPKELMYIPAILLLLLIAWCQKGRERLAANT